MNNQQRLEEIEQRLEVLNVLNDKLNTIINMMEVKSCVPNIQFTKANPNADDSELKAYEMELYSMLDKK